MATIDSLEIQISTSINRLNSTFKIIDKQLGNTLNKLSGINSVLKRTASLSQISGLEKFSMQMRELSESAKDIPERVERIGRALRTMSGTGGVDNNTSRFVSSFTRLANAGAKSEITSKNISKIGKSLKKIVSDMAGMRTIDSSINRFVSSLARLASAGDKSASVARELPALGKALKNVISEISQAPNISEITNKFTQSIAQLASAGDKTEKTAAGLSSLSKGVLDFFRTMQRAPAISENTIRMVEAMSRLTSANGRVGSSFNSLSKVVGGAFTTLKNTIKKMASLIARALSTAFRGLGKLSMSAASAVKSAAGIMSSAFSKIHSSSKKLNTASSNLKTLLKTAIGFRAVRGLFNFGRKAITLGSDITEVENVVDTAFGSMAQQAYDFAAVATKQFGLSELAAKNYSGTMMAMLKSSGVSQAAAARMSTTLAGLAGDIASFYNIETDEAFYKLRSAIAGQTMPMRTLGVNMNIVNLEAFAMSKGIKTAYKDMSLAEQTILRYNYILAKTGDAQGDFARTSHTWANQARLLKLNIESLSAVIGQGLIAAILPAVQALNALMSKLMGVANVFRDFMYVLTGNKVEGSTKGVVDDLAGIGDAAGNFEDMGDAAEEAGKKIKKILTLGLDELNILTENKDEEEEEGGFDYIEDFNSVFDKDVETPINKWAQRLRDAFLAQDWEELGKTIAEMMNIALKKIYDAIIDITPKVERALKAFARVFNSFVEHFDWELLGRTIGAGINLITTAVNALLGDDGIDFELLGNKLSIGFRGMIDEINWTGLGNAIGNWFMVAWRIAYGFIQDMWRIDPRTLLTGWAELGIGLGEAVNGIFERIDFKKIAIVLTEGFRGILEIITYALNTIEFDTIAQKINQGLEALYNGLRWEHIGIQITNFTSAVSKAFNDLLSLDFGMVGAIIGAGVTDIVRAFNQLTGEGGLDLERLGANISDGLRNLFSNIPWTELGNALGNGFMIGWRILDGFVTDMSQKNDAGITGWAQLGTSLGNAVNGIFQKVDFGAIANTLAAGFNGIVDILKNFVATIDWDSIATNLTNGINNLIHGINWAEAGATLSALFMEVLGVFNKVAQETDWEGLGRGIGEFLSNIDWAGIIGQVFSILGNIIFGLIDGLKETTAGKIILALAALKLAITGFDMITGVVKWLNEIAKTFGILPDGVTSIVPVIGEKLKLLALKFSNSPVGEAVKTFAAKIVSKLKLMPSVFFDTILPKMGEGVAKIVGEGGLFSKLFTGAKGLVSNIGPVLSSIGTVIFSPTGLLIMGIVAGVALIVTHWDEIKEAATKVADWVSEKWNGLKENVSKAASELKKNISSGWEKATESVSNALAELSTSIADKMESMKENSENFMDWVSGVFKHDWTENFGALGNVLNAFSENASNIWEELRTVFGGIIDFISGVFTGDWESAWNGVVDVFRGVFNLIPAIAENIINSIIWFINGIIGGINDILWAVGMDEIPEIPEVNIPRFATGGFPEDGLFFANHSELVGKFSNGKTAVANNEQIIAGIEEAAYRGFLRAQAESPYLANIAENTRRTAEKDTSISIDGREIVTAYDNRKARMGWSF